MPYQYSHRASSGEFGSAQVCVRRELLYSRGLKEGLSLENVEKRVLHSTHRATFYLTASFSTGSLPQGPSYKGSFHSVPRNAENFIHSERYVNASSNGSIGTAEMVPDRMEGQGLILVDGFSKARRIMDCSNVQQEQEDSSHVSTSFDKPLMWSRHQEALSCLGPSLQNRDTSATSNLTSLQTFQALMLHIPSDTIQSSQEFCEEDAEAPSTPDLRPEVRSWDCEAPGTIGVDQILPANTLCPKDVNDVLLEDNPCSETAGMLLLEEDNVISTCISRCPRGSANNVHTVTDQGRDICKGHSSLSDTSCKCSSSSLYDNRRTANSKRVSKMLNSSTCKKHNTFRRLLYFFLVSALSIRATSHNKEAHLQLLHTLQSRQLQRLLKWEGLNCRGETLCKQLLEGIQIFLQVYNPSLVSHHDHKAMEARTAEWYSKVVVHKHVHKSVNQNTGRRNGHHEKTGAEIIVQEQMFLVLHLLSQRYLARRSGDHFWLKCLYLDQDHVGNLELNQCDSVLTPGRCLVSASKVPNLLEVADGMLPRITQQSSVTTRYLEQGFGESHRLTCSSEATGLVRRVIDVSDANSIHIEEIGECPNTCLSNIQAHPSTVVSGLMRHPKLVGPPVIRSQSEDLNINYPNDSIIGGKSPDYYVHTEGKRHESSCLPKHAAKGPCRLTSALCGSSLGLSMQGLRPSMPHGRGQERQSREKLERFAEVFLLRRQIIQQQHRAQRAPPYPTRNVVADGKCSSRTGVQSSTYTPKYTNGNMSSLGNGDHKPTMIPISSLTKACDMTSTLCGQETFTRADVVIDIVELVKYLEGHSNQLEILTDTPANSIGCTYVPLTSAQPVLPNVGAVIVTIVAFVAYTKAFLEDALAWVESQAHSEEGN